MIGAAVTASEYMVSLEAPAGERSAGDAIMFDPDFAANKLHGGREPIGKNVVFLDE